MKSQRTYLITGYIIFTIALFAAEAEVCAQGMEKEWIVIRDQLPENSKHYNIALRYEPSESTLYDVSLSNVKSFTLPDDKLTEGYQSRLDFGIQPDGYQYSVLIRDARELNLINRDSRQIAKAQILRSKENNGHEIVKEGYFFLGNQLEIPFKVSGQQMHLPTNESIPGIFSINIYSYSTNSYQGSFSTRIKGQLTGHTFIDGANLEVSLSYRESLQLNGAYVKLTLNPSETTSGKITDIFKLRSAKLIVEKIASDGSEIVLGIVQGDIKQTIEEKPLLNINKPVPSFARVELLNRQLLTLEDLHKKTGPRRYIVLIFGELKRTSLDYRFREQETNQLTLDEKMVTDILQKGLKTQPVVVFVCRQLTLSDLYEKWLGKEPGFLIFADYSNPMDVQFSFPTPYPPSYQRPPEKIETLRGQLGLPEKKISILLINSEGNLAYINTDAGSQISESLTKINSIIKGIKQTEVRK